MSMFNQLTATTPNPRAINAKYFCITPPLTAFLNTPSEANTAVLTSH